MAPDSARFRFNVGNPPGPFHARAEFMEMLTSQKLSWEKSGFVVVPTLDFRLAPRHLEDYTLQFFLDDQLAYSGRFQDESLPF